jgi:hypothetical protein
MEGQVIDQTENSEYLAQEVQPVLTELVRNLLHTKPEDPVSHNMLYNPNIGSSYAWHNKL